jgi:hypothetical protein
VGQPARHLQPGEGAAAPPATRGAEFRDDPLPDPHRLLGKKTLERAEVRDLGKTLARVFAPRRPKAATIS